MLKECSLKGEISPLAFAYGDCGPSNDSEGWGRGNLQLLWIHRLKVDLSVVHRRTVWPEKLGSGKSLATIH